MQGRLDPWSLRVSKQSLSKFGGISLAENLTPHILLHQLYNHSIAWFIKAENQQSISPLTLYRVPQRNSSLHRQYLPTTLISCCTWQKLCWEHRGHSPCFPRDPWVGEKSITNCKTVWEYHERHKKVYALET